MSESNAVLDGLVTFYASHHAMRAEKVLKKEGFTVALVPGPREISPNCGVAMQFEYRLAAELQELLAKNKVQIEAVHRYLMELPGGKLPV